MRRLGFVPYSGFQTIVTLHLQFYSFKCSTWLHEHCGCEMQWNHTHTNLGSEGFHPSKTYFHNSRYSLILHCFPQVNLFIIITRTRYSKDSNKTQHIPHIYCLTNESRLFSSIISGRALGCEWVAVASVRVVRGNTGWVAAVLYHFKQFSVLVQF